MSIRNCTAREMELESELIAVKHKLKLLEASHEELINNISLSINKKGRAHLRDLLQNKAMTEGMFK